MVRTERLELSHLAAPEPKSGVSTNSTTSAKQTSMKNARLLAWRLLKNGVDDGFRTHDTRSHNPVLYQLSYAHHYFSTACFTIQPRFVGTPGRTRTCDHPLRRRMLYPAELRAHYAPTDTESIRKCLPRQPKLNQQWCFVAMQTAFAVFVKRGESYSATFSASTSEMLFFLII